MQRTRPRLEALEDRTAPAVLVVNSLADGPPSADGQLTLREAVRAATTNANSGDAPAGETSPDTIVFAATLSGGTILLDPGQGPLALSGGGDLSIVGPVSGSPDGITVSGGRATALFTVTPSAGAANLVNLTLADGNNTNSNGGALANRGPATTLSAVLIRGSRAPLGGAVYNDDANLTVINSTLIDNAAALNGGGINNNGGTVSVNDSTLARNSAADLGGALVNFTPSAVLLVSRSTVAQNTSLDSGGGLFNSAGTATLTDVTLTANVSAGGNGGGAVHAESGTVTLIHATVVGNSSTAGGRGSGGGLSKLSATLNARNSIIAGNFDVTPAHNDVRDGADDISGRAALDEDSNNFIGTQDGDPRVGPLADNGGPTQTMALSPGSPAIDAGNNNAPGVPSEDQRGFPRRLDGDGNGNARVDLGAFEFFPPTTAVALTVTQDGAEVTATATARTVTLRATVTGIAGAPTPTGSVDFFDGDRLLNASPIVLSEEGTATLPNVSLTAGTHALSARFNPSSAAFKAGISAPRTVTSRIAETVGVFDPLGVVFQLLGQNATTTTAPAFGYSFGPVGSLPVVGNWTGAEAEIDLPAAVAPVGGELQWTLADENPPVLPNLRTFVYGLAGQVPIAGDWDGDGTDGIGVYDPITATFALRNSPTGGAPDFTFAFGLPGLGPDGVPLNLPVTGDWDGDGTDSVGVYDPAAGLWSLAGANTDGTTPGLFAQFTFAGGPMSRPVAGDWDGDGTDGIGVFFPQSGPATGFGGFLLRNTPDAGAPDVNGGQVILAGLSNWLPLAGNWGPPPTLTNELLALASAGGRVLPLPGGPAGI